MSKKFQNAEETNIVIIQIAVRRVFLDLTGNYINCGAFKG